MKKLNKNGDIAGIIGGAGPEATNYFTSLLLKLRQPYATKDQDHIPYLVFNNPQIPDRTSYLLTGSESPLPELLKTGTVLKQAGASFLVIPCNTSHIFCEELEKELGLEVLNMVSLTAKYITYTFGNGLKLGLLATDGTVKTGIYTNAFKYISPQTQILIPTEKLQKDVMTAIYKIKARGVNQESIRLLESAAKHLLQNGADFIILGCTEIPLALKSSSRLIDPMEILAQHVIERTVSYKLKPQNSLKRFLKFFSHT